MRQWKTGKKSKEEYWRRRKEWKELLENKKKEKIEEEERQLRSIRNEVEAWKFINRYRGRRDTQADSKISREDWRTHFMNILEGKEEGEQEEGRGYKEKQRNDGKKEMRQGEAESEDIEEEEICRAVKKVKKGKVPGIDGIAMEAFIHGGGEIRRRVVDSIKEI